MLVCVSGHLGQTENSDNELLRAVYVHVPVFQYTITKLQKSMRREYLK